MELTTLLFLGFFAAVALLNYTLPRVLRPYCLLAASYLFYCWGANDRLLVVLTCGTAIVLAMEHNGNNVARWIRKQCFVLRWTVYYAAAVSILFFAAFGQSAFIYQQF